MEWEGQDVDDLLANTTVDISKCCPDSDSPLGGEGGGGREGKRAGGKEKVIGW